MVEPDIPGAFITMDPLESLQSGNFSKVPVVIGVTEDEGILLHSACIIQYFLVSTYPSFMLPFKFQTFWNILSCCKTWTKTGRTSCQFHYNSINYTRILPSNSNWTFQKKFANFISMIKPSLKIPGSNWRMYTRIDYLIMEWENALFYWLSMSLSTLTNLRIIVATTPFFDGWLSIKYLVCKVKLLSEYISWIVEVSGVAHVDEISFLFADSYGMAPEFKKNSTAEQVSKNFVKLWASFVTKG